MNWWLFPPNTRAVEFDEKWSFVGKKEKNCDRADDADDFLGDQWDHVAFDPEHRLVVSLVVGRRTEELTLLLVEDFHQRTDGRLMDRMTSDENPTYAAAILEVYGEVVVPERTGKPGRPPTPSQAVPEGLNYATVHKEREGGRVTSVTPREVYGSTEAGEICTSHVERYNGTDRNQNGRKVRKTYGFSKDWEVHEAMSTFVAFSYNFCWAVRTLRQGSRRQGYRPRTPALAAGLTDHVWTLREWVTFPAAIRTKTTPESS